VGSTNNVGFLTWENLGIESAAEFHFGYGGDGVLYDSEGGNGGKGGHGGRRGGAGAITNPPGNADAELGGQGSGGAGGPGGSYGGAQGDDGLKGDDRTD